jgi:hypothetical protein
MEKFMLIIREDLKKMQSFTQEDRLRDLPSMLKWCEHIAESTGYLAGEPLEPSGRYVRKDEVLSDGPFIESKEGVSGFTIITAENVEQATAIAQMCPLVIRGIAAVEVRPLWKVPEDMQLKINNG